MGSSVGESKKKEKEKFFDEEELFNEIYLFPSSKLIHTTTRNLTRVKHLSYSPHWFIQSVIRTHLIPSLAAESTEEARSERRMAGKWTRANLSHPLNGDSWLHEPTRVHRHVFTRGRVHARRHTPVDDAIQQVSINSSRPDFQHRIERDRVRHLDACQ